MGPVRHRIAAVVHHPPSTRRAPSAIDEEASQLIQRDLDLQAALQTSHKVNDLLLKRKKEELAQINTLAQELIAREYEYGTIFLTRDNLDFCVSFASCATQDTLKPRAMHC